MPLYMDFHQLGSEEIILKDLIKAHAEDVAIQEEYGVFEKKYWVNVEAKTLFCLTEAPNKEACNEVHKLSHGNTACNIIEVCEEEFSMYLGIGESKNDLAHTISGELDTGYRTILMIRTCDFTGKYSSYINKIHGLINQHNGVIGLQPIDDILVSFISASDAMFCANAIFKLLKSIPYNYLYKLAIVTGKPVDEKGTNIYEEAKKKIGYLNKIGSNNIIYLDVATKLLSDKEINAEKINLKNFRIITEVDFIFLEKLFNVLNSELYKTDFKSNIIYLPLGLSKSQAYRNIKSLTGMAPNRLIQELRLFQAIIEIKKNNKTIAEIGYDLGFNSPTYFTKVFKKRFGMLPTSFIKNSNI